MNYTYKLRTDIIFDEDNKAHTVYGIDLSENGIVKKSIKDIFFDSTSAERLVELCNSCNLSPIHLMDVIEDALP